jgi:hypothetical protein
MKQRFWLFIATMISLTPARAGILLGTNLPANNSAISVGACCFLAQPFTLTAGVNITNIDVQVAGTGIDSVTFWLTDKVGPGTTLSDVLFQTNRIFPNNGGTTFGETVSTPLNLTLSPGNYFLIMSSTSLAPNMATGPRLGWLLATSTLSSTVGSISNGEDTCCAAGSSTNTLFPPASGFVPFDNAILAFQLDGTAVPEPQTLFSLGTGAGVICLLGLRRIRRQG